MLGHHHVGPATWNHSCFATSHSLPWLLCAHCTKCKCSHGSVPPLSLHVRMLACNKQQHMQSCVCSPNSTADVAAAVKCSKTWGVRVIPRCGGHGNEGAPLPCLPCAGLQQSMTLASTAVTTAAVTGHSIASASWQADWRP